MADHPHISWLFSSQPKYVDESVAATLEQASLSLENGWRLALAVALFHQSLDDLDLSIIEESHRLLDLATVGILKQT